MAKRRKEQGSESPPDTQPEFGTLSDAYAQPQDAPAPAGAQVATRPAKRGRPGLMVLFAFLIELVLIAAGANQSVSRHLSTYVQDHFGTLLDGVAQSALVYSWRFTPVSGERDAWLGELTIVGGTLLLTVLLMLTVVRGPITFFRAFFGTWLSVIVATTLAAIGGGIVAKSTECVQIGGTPTADRTTCPPVSEVKHVTAAVFDGGSSYAFVAGVGLGVVVALIVAIIAVSTRRPVPVATLATPETAPLPPVPDAPEPFFGTGPDQQRGYAQPDYADTYRYVPPEPQVERGPQPDPRPRRSRSSTPAGHYGTIPDATISDATNLREPGRAVTPPSSCRCIPGRRRFPNRGPSPRPARHTAARHTGPTDQPTLEQ